MQPEPNKLAIVILAGGRATRFPKKLESDAGGIPLLVRVYHNVRDVGPVYLSGGEIPDSLRRRIDCPIVADRVPHRGPLGGLVSTFESVAADRIFVVAGDAPFVDATVLRTLADRWESGLQGVIAESSHGLEPLCALYDRQAFLTAAALELDQGLASVAAAAKGLRHERVLFPDPVLASINTPADRDALFGTPQCA